MDIGGQPCRSNWKGSVHFVQSPSPLGESLHWSCCGVPFGRPWLLILDKLHCPLEQRPPDPSQQDQLTSRRAG